MTGIVKWFCPVKKYGIIANEYRIVFIHIKHVTHHKILHRNDLVEFDCYEVAPNRFEARNLVKL